MPIYEFVCPNCGTIKEILQKINDDPPKCERLKCNGVEMIRQISLSSFALKGSGWAKDGYSKIKQLNKDKPVGGKK